MFQLVCEWSRFSLYIFLCLQQFVETHLIEYTSKKNWHLIECTIDRVFFFIPMTVVWIRWILFSVWCLCYKLYLVLVNHEICVYILTSQLQSVHGEPWMNSSFKGWRQCLKFIRRKKLTRNYSPWSRSIVWGPEAALRISW